MMRRDMTKEALQLEACPFCGHDAQKTGAKNKYGYHEARIACTNCPAEVRKAMDRTGPTRRVEEYVVDLWNRRRPSDALPLEYKTMRQSLATGKWHHFSTVKFLRRALSMFEDDAEIEAIRLRKVKRGSGYIEIEKFSG